MDLKKMVLRQFNDKEIRPLWYVWATYDLNVPASEIIPIQPGFIEMLSGNSMKKYFGPILLSILITVSSCNKDNPSEPVFHAWGSGSPPQLLSPGNGSVDQPTSVLLRWNGTSGALAYGVQVDTNIAFLTRYYTINGYLDTRLQLSGLSPHVKYYWRVNASTIYDTSGWLEIWNFTTGDPPAGPVISSYQ